MRVTISCKVCNGEALSRCSGCFSVAYCKAECQKSDWATHKPNCSKPYAVKENNKVGRYDKMHASKMVCFCRNWPLNSLILTQAFTNNNLLITNLH